MASYLFGWWFGTTSEELTSRTPSSPPSETPPPAAAVVTSPVNPPVAVSISTPEESQEPIIEEDVEVANDIDDDIPPAFPSLNSIQRSSALQQSTRGKAIANIDDQLMPPPVLPTRITLPSNDTNISSTQLFPPGGASAPFLLPSSNTLRIPSVLSSSSNTLKPPPSTIRAPSAPSKRREKVALAPGHSPLDWAALKASGEDLRGTPSLLRVTPSQLKAHNKRTDAWSSFNGKVYNITPYLSFHPGGEKEIMRVAGRDGTKLFALTHAWVNVEFMLDECMVGFLIPESSSAA